VVRCGLPNILNPLRSSRNDVNPNRPPECDQSSPRSSPPARGSNGTWTVENTVTRRVASASAAATQRSHSSRTKLGLALDALPRPIGIIASMPAASDATAIRRLLRPVEGRKSPLPQSSACSRAARSNKNSQFHGDFCYAAKAQLGWVRVSGALRVFRCL